MLWMIPKYLPIIWREELKNANRSALFYSCWLSTLAFFIFSDWYATILVSILIFVTIYLLFSRKRHQISRWFSVDTVDAINAVEKILINKGLPFDRKRNCYKVDNIRIELKAYHVRRVGLFGSQIYLGPMNDENRPLIEKLKEWLDDEFLEG